MTLRAVELHRVWMQILCRMFMEKKTKKKTVCYFTLPLHSFICVRKAPLTKPVFCCAGTIPLLRNLPEQEDHRKAIVGTEETDVTYNMLPENEG